MASPANAANDSVSNGPLGKRKKSHGSKGSYLSKWLDKTMQHIQDSTPSMDTYDSYINPNMNWPVNSQFAPGFDPYRYNTFGCTPEPMSLPTLPTYGSPATVPPFYTPEYRYAQGINKGVQVQRPRLRRRRDKSEEVSSTPKNNMLVSNPSMLQPKNFTDSQDFASLPPIVTSVGDTNSNSDLHTNEKDDGSNARRFSDPCVHELPDIAQPGNGDVESGSDSESSASGSQVGTRLLTCLLDQITSLKLSNERLSKELMETKLELDSVRQQTMLFSKGAPPNMGGPGGCSSMGNMMLGGQYSPGFVTEMVREIRDSARLRDEAMYSRLRAMVLERTDSGMASSDSKYSEKALEEIKSSLRTSESDKRRMMDRINKLEDELRDLKLNSCPDNVENKLTNGNTEGPEAECVRLRKELTDARKKKHNAEEHALKLERLVTQLRSKFNGLVPSTGPDSLSSDPDHDSTRPRRTSTGANSTNSAVGFGANSTNSTVGFGANSTANSTVVFGPVTDL